MEGEHSHRDGVRVVLEGPLEDDHALDSAGGGGQRGVADEAGFDGLESVSYLPDDYFPLLACCEYSLVLDDHAYSGHLVSLQLVSLQQEGQHLFSLRHYIII